MGETWQRSSKLPADHVLAGAFDSAMRILHQELGIVNFEPLKPIFLSLFSSCKTSLSGIPSVPSMLFPLQIKNEDSPSTPVIPISVSSLVQQLQVGYQTTTSGKFGEALHSFRNILYWSLFVVTRSKSELNEVFIFDFFFFKKILLLRFFFFLFQFLTTLQ